MPSRITVTAGTCVGQVWIQAGLGQALALTGIHESQDRVWALQPSWTGLGFNLSVTVDSVIGPCQPGSKHPPA